MSFFTELKRRNVIRMAGLYLVGAWIFIQIAETLLPVFDTPGWVLKALVVLLAIGFLPALVFSWVFELTPAGIKRDDEGAATGALAPQTARRMNRTIIVLLVAGLGYFAVDKFVLAPQREANPLATAPANPADDREAMVQAEGDKSIAVLPFANMSGQPDQDYFSDGMTEELLNVLAKVPQLKVVARTSVFEFKGKGGDVREIGSKLGVGHIVEGSVRRDGQEVRVTAQLIRVADGFHVWSESYDRKLEGVFALQDDIAQHIGDALKQSLGVVAAIAARAPVDPAAYDEYLKGRGLLRARQDLPQAIEHFKAAVAKAPDFAEGWSTLSLAYEVSYWYTSGTPPQRAAAIDAAAVAATRAAGLAADAATTAHALGNVARAQFRYAEAEQHYLRALQTDPTSPDVREDYSELLYIVGRVADSARAARALLNIDPYFAAGWTRLLRASIALDARADVAESVQHLLANWPDSVFGKFGALDFAVTRGRRDEAYAALAEIEARWPAQAGYARVLLPWAMDHADGDVPSVDAAIMAAPSGVPSTFLIARQDIARYNAYMTHDGAILQTYYFGDIYHTAPIFHAMLNDPRVKARLVDYGFVNYWRAQGWPAGCRPLDNENFECDIDSAGVP